MASNKTEEKSRPRLSFRRTKVSTARPMMTGPTRVAQELTSMAAIATARRPRSGTIKGAKRLIPARRERFPPNTFVVSSLYFIDIGAPLRVVDLHVFRGSLHKIRVGSGGEHLAFHQKDDLVVVLDGRDLLGYRDQSDAGILFVDVPQNGALGGGIDARGEIVEQQHLGIQRQCARQHHALILAAGKAGPALGDYRVEPLRQGSDEV